MIQWNGTHASILEQQLTKGLKDTKNQVDGKGVVNMIKVGDRRVDKIKYIIYRIFKELKKINTKKTNNPGLIKMGHQTKQIFPGEEIQTKIFFKCWQPWLFAK